MTPRNLKILQVCPDCPYPPDNGGRLDIWKRTLSLRSLGYAVDLLATVRGAPAPNDAAAMRNHINQMWFVDRLANWRGILSPEPIQIATRSQLASVRLESDYDVVLLEGEACNSILSNPTLKARRTVIRIHNDEVRFFREQVMAEPRLWRKAYFKMEERRYAKCLPAIHKRADQLWFISHDEWAGWANGNQAGRTQGFWLPPALQTDQVRQNSSTNRHVLFLGTLTAPTNVEAVEWYYRNVHSRLLPIDDYRFVVAGNSRGQEIAPIFREVANDSRCSLIKDVADLVPLFDSCSVFVSPIVRGAGVKMKVISAMEAGLPVVSTSVGCEGTGLLNQSHILISDSAEDFASGVRTLLEDVEFRRRLAKAGQQQLKRVFSQEQRLTESLSALADGLQGNSRAA